MTSLQMQAQFLRINLAAIAVCVATMYVAIVRYNLGVMGFIIGFASRFYVEIGLEVVHLYKHFPPEGRTMPSLGQVRAEFWESFWFSLVFVVGFSMEVFLFETSSCIFFQAPNAEENIALWMCLYQLNVSGRVCCSD